MPFTEKALVTRRHPVVQPSTNQHPMPRATRWKDEVSSTLFHGMFIELGGPFRWHKVAICSCRSQMGTVYMSQLYVQQDRHAACSFFLHGMYCLSDIMSSLRASLTEKCTCRGVAKYISNMAVNELAYNTRCYLGIAITKKVFTHI